MPQCLNRHTLVRCKNNRQPLPCPGISDALKGVEIPVLQLNRWEYLLEDHITRAQQMGLDSYFIKAVFELIHTQAVKKQL